MSEVFAVWPKLTADWLTVSLSPGTGSLAIFFFYCEASRPAENGRRNGTEETPATEDNKIGVCRVSVCVRAPPPSTPPHTHPSGSINGYRRTHLITVVASTETIEGIYLCSKSPGEDLGAGSLFS